MTTIGTAVLQIIPSLDGVSKSVEKQLGGALDGKKFGKSFGKDIADGVKASEADVKRAMDAYGKLYDKQKDALGKVAAEQAKLNDLQNKGVGGGRLVTQSERLEKAKRDEARALREARDGWKEYETAADRAANAGKDVGGGLLDKLKGLAGNAKSSGTDAATGFVEGFGGPIAALGTKAGPIGLALAAAAIVATGAGVVIAKQVMAGLEQEQQQANVAAKLGLSAEQMKPIADASARAYASNFGESVAANMDTARAAIQSGLLDPNATQADVQTMVQQLSTVSDVMGEDIPATARAAQQAIRTGLAGSATEAFDLFTKAQQSGLNVSDDFLDTINEYGTQFRKLGLSGPEAIGLISQAVKGGARDTDVAADALKEFSIRAVDGSKLTADSFSAIGLNADDMAAKFAAGGPTAKAAFDQVVDTIRGIDDPVKRASVSVGLFGTQAEDLGGALGTLDLSTAVDQLGQVDGAAQRASDTMGNTTSGSVESAKRSIETAVSGMQQSLATAFGPSLEQAAAFVTAHQDEITQFFVTGANVATEFASAVVTSAGSIITGLGWVVASTGDLVGFMVDGFEQIVGAAAVVADALGADGIAADLRGAKEQLGGMSDSFHGWGEDMIKFGGDLSKAGADLHDIDLKAGSAGSSAEGAAGKVSGLGTALGALPATKDMNVTLNDAAARTRADELARIIGGLPGAKQINIDAIVVYKDTAGVVIPPDQLKAPVRAPAVPGDTYHGPGRAGGGMIPGFSTRDDRLGLVGGKGLIGLAGGEGIINARSTRNLGGAPFIDFLNGFAGGGVVPDWDAIAQKESGGRWNLPYGDRDSTGGLQIRQGTWDMFGGQTYAPAPYQATKDQQIAVAEKILAAQGPQAWAGGKNFVSKPAGAAVTATGSANSYGVHPQIGVVAQIAERFGLKMTSGQRNEPGSFHNSGMAGDFSNGSGNTKQELAFAKYMADNFGSQIQELIYSDPNFSQLIGGGKNVTGTGYYSAGTLGEHRNHVHVAIKDGMASAFEAAARQGGEMVQGYASSLAQGGQAAADASPFAGGSATAAVTGAGTAAPNVSSDSGTTTPSSGADDSSSISLPSSFSGLAGMGLDGLGIKTKVTSDALDDQGKPLFEGPDRTLELGKAAATAVGGQVDSALGVLGIPGDPPWLKAISTFIGGISIGGGGSAGPLSAAPTGGGVAPPDDPGNMHGARGGQAPGPNVTINARDTEDAFVKYQRYQDQRSAAKLSRF